MMKRIVSILFFLGLIGIGMALIAPSFINWNDHKDQILSYLSPYFKTKVEVAGNVSLQLLPQPEILMEQVSVSNVPGTKSNVFMTLKQLGARVKLGPLLEGRIEVETVNLVDPVLNLEILEDGKANWSGILRDKKAEESATFAPSTVQLNQVTVTNGTLNYMNRLTGTGRNFDNLNLSINADTLLGPYRVQGDMMYSKSPVKIDIRTETYDQTRTVPIQMAFMPTGGNLPQVKLNGVMDLQSGIDIQGEVAISQGKMSALLNMQSLHQADFLNDTVNMTGVIALKGDQFTLSNIKAKFGEDSAVRGKVVLQFPHSGAPAAAIDIEGDNLVLTRQPSDIYTFLPDDFTGSLRFKGKNIVWEGRAINEMDISAALNEKEWNVQSAQMHLPGPSQIKLTGIVTPKTGRASYTAFQLASADLGKLVDFLTPGDSSIFQPLGSGGLTKTLQLSSSLELSPEKISFFNIDAAIDGKVKVTGVLNIDRSSPKPNFVAKLHTTDWNTSAFAAGTYDRFWQKIMQSNADMEVTSKNYTKNGLKIADMSFKAKTDGQGLAIQELSGSLSEKENFSLTGHVGGLAPFSAVDISYTLKAADITPVARAIDITLPAAASLAKNVDIKGTIKGDTQNYAFTVEGAAVSGLLQKQDDKYTAELGVDKIDLEKTLSDEWLAGKDVALKLRGNAMTWRGLSVSKPSLVVKSTPASLEISSIEGFLWGGKLNAEASFVRQDKTVWPSRLKGSLKQADLELFRSQLSLKDFQLGTGDIDFDLTAADNTKESAAGTVAIKADTLTTDRFNFSKLSDAVQKLQVFPDDTSQFVDNIFRANGATVFKDVAGKFNLEKGKLSIESLHLQNNAGDMPLSGYTGIDGVYDVTGSVSVKGLPPIKISRTSDMPDYTIDSKDLADFLVKNKPAAKPPEPTPSPAPVSTPPAKSPASEDKNAVKDILQRLDDEDKVEEQNKQPPLPEKAEEPEPLPAPVPAQPPVESKPDVQDMMMKMQMQEMMPETSY